MPFSGQGFFYFALISIKNTDFLSFDHYSCGERHLFGQKIEFFSSKCHNKGRYCIATYEAECVTTQRTDLMLITFMATFNRTIKKYFELYHTIRQLKRLSNRDLADLGITRGDIDAVAKRSVDQKFGS
jgi:uncharacterized protein YjiS (DUF1127 family)